MSYRTFKRRLSEIASHDLLEWFAFALGLAFFALAGVRLGRGGGDLVLGDPDPEFKTSAGFLQATRGVGIVLFGLFALVAAGVGWFLAGDTIRRIAPRLTPGRSPRLQPPIADIERSGWRKSGWLIRCPDHFRQTLPRISASRSSSLAPERSGSRRSVSSSENRQARRSPRP